MKANSHGIIGKFLGLLTAQWLRDGLHTLLTVVLARRGSATYGEFLLSFSLAQFILFLGEFGLNQPMVLALSRKWGNKGEVLLQYTAIKTCLLLLGLSAVLSFAWLQGYNQDLFWMVFGLSLGCGLEPLAGSFFVACRVRGRQDAEATIRGLCAALGYGWGLCALALGAPVWIFALFKVVENLCNLAANLWFTLGWDKITKFNLGRRGLARAWSTAKQGAVFVLMALAAIGYNKANVFFLQKYGGPEQVGAYGVSWELVDGVSNLVASLLLSGVIYPLLVKLWRADQKEFTRLSRQTSRVLTACALPVMAFLAMEADRLSPLIFGASYQDQAWLTAWLAPSVLIAFLHNLAAYMMLAWGRERLLLAIYAGGLGFSLVICAWLIPAFGIWGAAMAMVGTKAAVAACTVGYCQRRAKLLDWSALAWICLAMSLAALAWRGFSLVLPREAAEALALCPLLLLVWRWRPVKRQLAPVS